MQQGGDALIATVHTTIHVNSVVVANITPQQRQGVGCVGVGVGVGSGGWREEWRELEVGSWKTDE